MAHLKAAEWLDKAPANPFFLSVGFIETHRKYPKHKNDINTDHLIPPKPLPDVPEVREDIADFMESASILDEKMGTVMKCNLCDRGTGIFMIMRGPGGFSGGRTINSMVSVIDIFPTICELLEIEKPGWITDGKI